jgi:hypothetical protein
MGLITADYGEAIGSFQNNGKVVAIYMESHCCNAPPITKKRKCVVISNKSPNITISETIKFCRGIYFFLNP